jgi:sulfate/thiosulfate transport system ATP-binding protein
MSIRVAHVTKRFGTFTALDDVSVHVPTGSLCALLGPSGSGKTTLLRVLAGLEVPDAGSVHVHDDDVTRQSARQRGMGFVFQHYALFRQMTVFENIAFPLRVRSWPAGRIRARVHELLQLVRLDSQARRLPGQLSGGQRQRVALVRALAAQPRVLLLDEPFGALDAKVRLELRQWLRRYHDDFGVTSIFVTHDQEEAFEVADRVVVMRQGRTEQVGSPQQIFDHPANAFVMDFLGNVNIFHGRMERGRLVVGDVEVNYDAVGRDHAGGANSADGDAALYVRPHELDIERSPLPGGLAARVLHVNPAGPLVRVHLTAVELGMPVLVELQRERLAQLALRSGEVVYVVPRRVRVFAPEYSI